MLLWTCALLFVLQVAGALFGWHRRPLAWLRAAESDPPTPAVIVVLGGGGIPSESGLLRCYHAATLARAHPDALCIVSLPADDPEAQSTGRMRDELVMRGVAPERILMEARARNTHEQAVAVREMLGDAGLEQPVWIVTSGAHMRRALLCFQRQGFSSVHGLTARVTGAEGDIGPGAFWRYGVWSHLESQVEMLREWTALAYYWRRGWI
jgi:uncharacterized SAM-binding protein YcdF (DUF218 family)